MSGCHAVVMKLGGATVWSGVCGFDFCNCSEPCKSNPYVHRMLSFDMIYIPNGAV